MQGMAHGEEGPAAERSEAPAASDETFRSHFAAWLGGMSEEARQLAFLLEREEASAPLRRLAADSINQLLHAADLLPEGTEALGYLETLFAFRLLAAEQSEAAFSAPRLPKPRPPKAELSVAERLEPAAAEADGAPLAEGAAASGDAELAEGGQAATEAADVAPAETEETQASASEPLTAEGSPVEESAAVESAAVDPAAVESAAVESAAVESAAVEADAQEAAIRVEAASADGERAAVPLPAAPEEEVEVAAAAEDAAAAEEAEVAQAELGAELLEVAEVEAVAAEAPPLEEEPEEEPEPASASDESYAVVRRLAPQAALVRAFLGADDAERLRRLVLEQRSRSSRGRSSKEILLQADARAAAASDARDWAELYEAPEFGSTQHDLLRLRTFMRTRVRRGAS